MKRHDGSSSGLHPLRNVDTQDDNHAELLFCSPTPIWPQQLQQANAQSAGQALGLSSLLPKVITTLQPLSLLVLMMTMIPKSNFAQQGLHQQAAVWPGQHVHLLKLHGLDNRCICSPYMA